jgi:hypothetical protein
MAVPPQYSSYAVSRYLYELTGWEGDVEWEDWLPISDKNYPAYTCGYLLRKLENGIMKFYLNVDPLSPDRRYWVKYRDRQKRKTEAMGSTIEDTLALFCVRLTIKGMFESGVW